MDSSLENAITIHDVLLISQDIDVNIFKLKHISDSEWKKKANKRKFAKKFKDLRDNSLNAVLETLVKPSTVKNGKF